VADLRLSEMGLLRCGPVETLARFVLRHRLLVGVSWLALFVAGGVAAGPVAGRLTFDFSLPGQPGYQAERQLIATFGTSTADTLVPVITVPAGTTVQQHATDIARVFAAVRTRLPQARVVDLASTGDPRFVTTDGRSTFALVQGPEPQGFGPGLEASLTPILRAAVASAGLQSGVTSYGLLAAGGNSSGPSVLVETLFGALGALAVLVFVFASFLAFVPLIIAAVSILTTFLLVLALTYLTDVSFVVQFLIALVGLGVAIDYSLLLVSRWREERAHGHTNDEAVVVAVQTAGHAVLASGVTVAISLLALVVVPVPFLRSMGLGGMLIPLVSVAVVLTLLPALLSKLGPRVDWPRIRHDAVAARGWSAWARLIVRRRWVAAGVAAVALGLVIAPVFGLKIGQAGTDSLARSGSAFNVLQQLQKGGVGNGILTPIEVLVPQGQAKAAVAAAAGVRGVRTAAVGGTKGGLAVVDVIPAKETVDSASNGVVNDVRTAVENATDGSVGVAGTGAIVQDYHNFPYVLALIAVITFVLLVRTFARCCCRSRRCCSTSSRWRGLRRRRLLLAARARLRRGVRGLTDRRHHVLATRNHLRVPVRVVDGLRGVHPGPNARGIRRDRLHRAGCRHRPRAHRAAGDLGSPDPVLFLRRAGFLTRHRHQGARHRARSWHPHRRHPGPGSARARTRQSVRPLELVAPGWAGPDPAGQTLTGHRRRIRPS